MDENPEEIWLQTNHHHELSVVTLETRGHLNLATTTPAIAEVTADGTIFKLNARSLGRTDLQIVHSTKGHRDQLILPIRTVSPRVTVVTWIDADAIDIDEIARNAGPLIKEVFSNRGTCFFALYQWLKATHQPPFGILSEADAMYAKAMLIKASGNSKPPNPLPATYKSDGDYKLFHDLQVSAAGTGNFDDTGLPRASLIGETHEPCDLLPEEVRQLSLLSIDGEAHELNDQYLPARDAASVIHLNQARINKYAQRIERNLTDRNAKVGDVTPWIWSAIRVSPSGEYGVCTQIFPSYSVYVDNQLVAEKKQSNLAHFLKLDHNSQFVSNSCW